MNEQLKQRLMLAIVAFNLCMISYIIVTQFSGPSVGSWGSFLSRLVIGAGIGLVVGAIVFVGAMVMKK